MPFTLTMPKLSPTMEEGSIAKWHKKPGQYAESGELLLEIATDKATIEYDALDAGWLRKILVEEGKEAFVNQPIAIFTEEENESIEGYEVQELKSAPAVAMSEINEGQTEPQASKESQQSFKESKAPPEKPQSPSLQVRETAKPSGSRILASPLARRIAKEQGIDLANVTGTGPGGRIMKRDLTQSATVQEKSQAQKAMPTETEGAFEEVTLTPMRKVIASRLQEAKASIPHFYVRQAIDACALVNMREQLKKCGIAVTYNDLILRAVALSLKEHPLVNSGFDGQKRTLLRFKTIDISIAVSVEGGLVTPIVRFADFKSVLEISEEVKALIKRAKDGKLQPQEYQGGSFTVSNLGMFNVTDFQAIINPPQAAILAVSGISDVALVKNHTIVPGKQMNLSLSVDHRAIDGAAAALFMQTLKLYLEQPAALLI